MKRIPTIYPLVPSAAVGKPGGKSRQTMKSIYESMLGRPAPIELCRAFELPAKSNFATALFYRAVYKTPAVKFLVQLTEAPLPTRKRETEHIDHAAGLAAKQLLIKKLERG